MFKNIFNSAKCLLGFHQGDWKYEKPKSCEQFQVCTHCGKRSTKVEHTWGDWKYRADNDCRQTRVCNRCEEKEEQTVHVWGGDAYYKKDNDCSTVNYCERCRAEKSAGVIHEWGSWIYINDESCDQKQKCNRCGTIGGKQRVEHAWEGWQYSLFYKARVNVCQHCGLMPLNFDNTNTYTIAVQNVDTLFGDLAQANSVSRIIGVIRQNKDSFKNPLNPAITAYIELVSTHMPNEGIKKIYQSFGTLIQSIGATGVDIVLQYLGEVQYQSTDSPWELALAKISEAARYVRRQNSLDKRLIGHWRYTEILGGGGMSLITDYNEILRGDGYFEEFSVSAGMGSNSRTAPLTGRWSSENNVIYIQFDDGRSVEIPYQFSGTTLLLPLSGETRYWERVG